MFISVEGHGESDNYNEKINVNLIGGTKSNIKVRKGDKIGKIKKFFKKENSRIVYNGVILNDILSFSFYDIDDNDTIFVVEPPITNKRKRKFDIITDDELNDIIRKIHTMHNKDDEDCLECQKETLRLLDISFSKLMYRPAPFRKACRMVQQRSNKINENLTFNTVLPTKAISPSTELLPLGQCDSEEKSN